MIYFLGSARKSLAAADEGNGLPSMWTSALAIAIPQAVRALSTTDKTAAANVQRRQLLNAWLDLAPVAGITSDPCAHLCCGCGQANARFRCNKCRSAVCSRACQKLSWAAHRPFCTDAGILRPPALLRPSPCPGCAAAKAEAR